MKTPITIAVAALGLVLSVLATATLLGLGVLRDATPWALGLASAALVALPIVGLASVAGRPSLRSTTVSLVIWPIALLLGLPIYFPGERTAALATGLGFMASPMGPDATETAVAIGQGFGAVMGAEAVVATPPLQPIEVVEDDDVSERDTREDASVPAPTPLTGDELALPYEGAGRSLRIPVVLEQDGHPVEHWMIFDTGATYTTLTREVLAELGVEVSADAPIIELHTANGVRRSPVVLLDKVWLGGFAVEGVTVAVCEECAGDETVGLLGLNVSGQYTVTLDPGRREMVLKTRTDSTDRHLDISHWVSLSGEATQWTDGRVSVAIEAENLSDRRISEVTVGIQCGDEEYRTTVTGLRPGAMASSEKSLPRGAPCAAGYTISLDAGHW